jgi:ABC-type phosphate/phosphonate transport system ATPase subunit
VLHLDAVGLRYGDGPEILKDITFRLDEGAFCFLTGASGSGKTSLLRLLVLAAASGRSSGGASALYFRISVFWITSRLSTMLPCLCGWLDKVLYPIARM